MSIGKLAEKVTTCLDKPHQCTVSQPLSTCTSPVTGTLWHILPGTLSPHTVCPCHLCTLLPSSSSHPKPFPTLAVAPLPFMHSLPAAAIPSPATLALCLPYHSHTSFHPVAATYLPICLQAAWNLQPLVSFLLFFEVVTHRQKQSTVEAEIFTAV